MIPDWSAAERVLTPALERDREATFEAVREAVERGQAHLWQVPEAAAVTQFNRDLHVWLAGGVRTPLLSMLAGGESFARGNGCDRMTIDGRRGWTRLLAPLGYRPRMLLVKDL